jgi:hypothetical protein
MRSVLGALCVAAAVSLAACVGALPGGTLGQPDTGGGGAAANGGTGGSVSPTGGAPERGGAGGLGGSRGGRPGTGGSSAAGAAGGASCGPTGVRLASDHPWNIALSGTGDSAYLFWVRRSSTGSGELVKTSVKGGEPIVLASASGQPNSVAVDATHVYWSNGARDIDPAGDILRADLDGGNLTTLVAGQGEINEIAAGADGIYFTTTAAVKKVGLDGGTPTLLAAMGGTELAVDTANAYWSTLGGQIVKAGIAGGSDPVVLVPADATPDSIAIDATHVYWVNARDRTVMRVSLAGDGQPESLFAPGTIQTCSGTNGWARSVAVDATGVHWLDLAGNVFAGVPGQPDLTRVVANTGKAAFRGAAVIVLDSATVYWMNVLGVYAIPK